MIQLHKTPTEMMGLINKWYDQHKTFDFIGYEDEDKFKEMLGEQYSIDWTQMERLPEHNYDKRPKNNVLAYVQGCNGAPIGHYFDCKRFFTDAGSQRNNRRRLELRKNGTTIGSLACWNLKNRLRKYRRLVSQCGISYHSRNGIGQTSFKPGTCSTISIRLPKP